MTATVQDFTVWTGGIGSDGHYTYNLSLRVHTSTPNDGPSVVLEAVRAYLPRQYSLLNDNNPNAVLHSIGEATRVNVDASNVKWDVPCVYSTKPLDREGGPSTPVTDLLAETWKIGGSFVQRQKFTDTDKDGLAILTSSKEMKIVEIPDGYDTLNLSGPSHRINLLIRAQARFKVNETTMWVFSPRMLLLNQWSYDVKFLPSGDSYVVHDFSFLINYDLWNEVYLDAGFREYLGKVGGVPIYRPILGSNDLPTSTAVPLDGFGEVLDIDGAPEGVHFTKLVLKEYEFHNIGLPDPLPGPFV